MIVTMFQEPREQAKAIGVYAFVASAGGSIGLLVGGVLTQAINWHWIFFVNVPIGIATGAVSRNLLERDKGIGIDQGADVLGAALITSALMLGVYAIVKPAPGLGIVAGALLIAFVAREATARRPLMPLRLFRSRNVAGANLIQALSVAGMFGVFFLGSLYLQRVLGYSALGIGLAFVPTTLLMGGLSLRYTERLVTRFGARATLRPGLVLIALGMVWFARAPVHASYPVDVMPAMVMIGIGCGICFPSLMTLSMSGATPSDAGLASGLVNTTVQVGGALGLAVLATVAAHHSHGSATAAALTSGYHLAFLIGGVLVLTSLVVAMVVLEAPAGIREPRPSRVQAQPAESA
jgi:MFS family permease